MRLFYFSGATIPSQSAQSVHVMKMCQALGKAGHDVTLFARGESSLDIEFIYQKYDVSNCFDLSLSKSIQIPFVGGVVRLLHIWKTVRRLSKADVYYGRDPIALALLGGDSGKIIYEAHQMAYLPTHKFVTKHLQRRSNFGGFVTISEALKNDFLSEYPNLKSEQVLVAHDGADLVDLSMVSIPELKGRQDAFKVGYAGSLHAGKGAELILKIAQLLPDVDFHILGGSSEQISNLSDGCGDNVYFYGHLPHVEIKNYLSSFDVLLAPYQKKARIKTGQNIARWISPMKLFEYMAFSKPILCSDLPVLREILEDGSSALMLPPDQPEAWSKGIEELVEDNLRSTALGEAAFSVLKNNYSWDERARRVIEFCS